MNEQKKAALLKKALKDLKIDVPVMAVKVLEAADEGSQRLELYLYGGRVVTFPPPAKTETSKPKKSKAK